VLHGATIRKQGRNTASGRVAEWQWQWQQTVGGAAARGQIRRVRETGIL
jgi:hypothetical protein